MSYMGMRSAQPDTARSVTRNLRNLPVAAPVRSKHIYNNIMFTVATHIIETKTGVPFPEFLENRFFTPLNMTSSNLQPARSREKGLGDRIASGHMWDEQDQGYREFTAPDKPERQGAGSIVTSAEDYIKWIRALMRREKPVTEGVYRGLTTIRSLSNPAQGDVEPMTSPIFYCAGLEVRYYRGHAIFGHSGVAEGYGSRHFFIPSLDFCGILLGNGPDTALATDVLVRELTDSVLGVESLQVPTPAKTQTERKSEPQKMPLEVYVGQYWNPGYHGIDVQIKDSGLFIDANERSFPREIRLRHISGQTRYTAHIGAGTLVGGMPDVEQVRAEFAFDNDRVVKLGIAFADGLEGLIWFHRVQDAA